MPETSLQKARQPERERESCKAQVGVQEIIPPFRVPSPKPAPCNHPDSIFRDDASTPRGRTPQPSAESGRGKGANWCHDDCISPCTKYGRHPLIQKHCKQEWSPSFNLYQVAGGLFSFAGACQLRWHERQQLKKVDYSIFRFFEFSNFWLMTFVTKFVGHLLQR